MAAGFGAAPEFLSLARSLHRGVAQLGMTAGLSRLIAATRRALAPDDGMGLAYTHGQK